MPSSIETILKGMPLLKGKVPSEAPLSTASTASTLSTATTEKAQLVPKVDRRKQKEYCQKCTDLANCQYTAAGHRGFIPQSDTIILGCPTLKECEVHSKWVERMRSERLFGESGLPLRSQNLTLNDLNSFDPPTIDAAMAFINGTVRQFMMCGHPGEGKTTLLSIIGKELINRGKTVKYVTATELTMLLRYNNPNYEERYNELTKVPYLLLDDSDSYRESEYNRQQIELVINKRLRANLPTATTSNAPER